MKYLLEKGETFFIIRIIRVVIAHNNRLWAKINEFVSQTWRHWYRYRWYWKHSTIVIRGMWALLGPVRLVLCLLGTARRWRSIRDRFPEYVTVTGRTENQNQDADHSGPLSYPWCSVFTSRPRVYLSLQNLFVMFLCPSRQIHGLEHQNILRSLPSVFIRHQ